MPRRINGILHYSGPEIEYHLKAVLLDVILEMQGTIVKKTLEHKKLAHLLVKPKAKASAKSTIKR